MVNESFPPLHPTRSDGLWANVSANVGQALWLLVQGAVVAREGADRERWGVVAEDCRSCRSHWVLDDGGETTGDIYTKCSAVVN